METIPVSAIIASLISRIHCSFHARGNSECIAGNHVFIECARVLWAHSKRVCSNTRKINLNADYPTKKIIDTVEEN